MSNCIEVKLVHGTYTCVQTGGEYEGTLLSRSDRPGVVYPFPAEAFIVELLASKLDSDGLALFHGLVAAEGFEETPDREALFEFEFYLPEVTSKEVH